MDGVVEYCKRKAGDHWHLVVRMISSNWGTCLLVSHSFFSFFPHSPIFTYLYNTQVFHPPKPIINTCFLSKTVFLSCFFLSVSPSLPQSSWPKAQSPIFLFYLSAPLPYLALLCVSAWPLFSVLKALAPSQAHGSIQKGLTTAFLACLLLLPCSTLP